jgi:caffeoyl-CoA O-methyltransferase
LGSFPAKFAKISGVITFMFHSIRQSVLERMKYLEQIDIRDRDDGTPRSQRLRQIDRALTDNRVDAMIVPIGKGELVCRKI